MFRQYSSEEIIKGLLSPDNKVYRYLDRVYCPKVIAYVRKNSGTHEDGEDLYRETIYKVYIMAEQGKYDPKLGKFGAYFMTIARNSWLDELRRRKRSVNTIPIDDTLEQMIGMDETEQADHDSYYRRVQRLRACIARLNKEEQEMIRLFYFARQSLDAVAKKMNITYNYARTKIDRIRKKLKKMMEDDPDSDIEFVLV